MWDFLYVSLTVKEQIEFSDQFLLVLDYIDLSI